jgi:DNA-binding protein YbaB
MAEIHSVEGLADYAHQQIERIQRMERELAEQVGEGTSRDGHVKAKTGAAGVLKDLKIDAAAMRLSPEELTAEVRSAISAAQADFARRADDIMGPILHVKPSEHANAAIEQGMQRLDALTADLERLARARGLDS